MSPHDEEPVKHDSPAPAFTGDSMPGKAVAEWSARGHVAEETMYAWLDGAFDVVDAATVKAHVDQCPACRALEAEARGYVAATSRIIKMADLLTLPDASDMSRKPAVPPGEPTVLPLRAASIASVAAKFVPSFEQPTMRRWYAGPGTRAAAGLLLVLGAGAYLMSNGATLMPVREMRTAEETTRKEKAPVSALTPAPTTTPAAVSAPRKKAVVDKDAGAAIAAGTSAATPLPPAQAPATTPAPRPTPVGGSNTVLSFPSNIGAPGPLVSRITVVGTVTTPEGRAVEGAQVTVLGGVIGAITNSNGEFVLRDVPVTASLQVRRIGYMGIRADIPDVVNDTARLGAHLSPSSTALSAVTVTANRGEIAESRIARCLRVTVDSASAFGAPFQLIEGSLEGSGSHRLNVVGWPSGTARTSAEFRVSDDGTVRSTMTSASARLDILGLRNGSRWSGTVDELRDGRTRRHFVSFVPDSGATWCGR